MRSSVDKMAQGPRTSGGTIRGVIRVIIDDLMPSHAAVNFNERVRLGLSRSHITISRTRWPSKPASFWMLLLPYLMLILGFRKYLVQVSPRPLAARSVFNPCFNYYHVRSRLGYGSISISSLRLINIVYVVISHYEIQLGCSTFQRSTPLLQSTAPI